MVYVNAPPLENDVQVPRLLTMDEAIDAIYLYAKDKNLLDENNLASINNDSKLESIFECKTMTLAQAKEWIVSKGHLVPVVLGTPGDAPIVLTYIMKKDTADNPKNEKQDAHKDVSDNDLGLANKRRRTSVDATTR